MQILRRCRSTRIETEQSPRRRGGRAALVLLTALVCAIIAPAEADAAAKEFIEFDDGTTCEVGMQNVHDSGTARGEASVAVGIRCRPPGGGPKGERVVEQVTAETTIGFSTFQPIPGLLPGEPIGTCPRQTKVRIPRGTITCHQPGRGGGYYTGTSNVTVTYLGVTEEVDVNRVNFFTPPV